MKHKKDLALRFYILLGEKIRIARQAEGLSLRAFATKSRLGFGSVSKIELGKANPSIITLARIAEALNIDLLDLLDFDYSPSDIGL